MSESGSTEIAARRSRLVWIIAIGSLLYLFLGAIVLPRFLEVWLPRIIEDRTGRPARLETVRVDPIRFRVSLIGFEWPRPDEGSDRPASGEAENPGPGGDVRDVGAIAFESLIIDLRPFGFVRADLALDELVLSGPRVVADIDSRGELNLSRLLAPLQAADPPEDADAGASSGADAGPIVEIGSVRIEDGAFLFRDRRRTPRFELGIESVDLEIEAFSTRAGSSSVISFGSNLGDSTALTWQGTISLAPLRSEGRVALSALDLRIPWHYAEESLRFDVPAGSLGAEARYRVSFEDEWALSIEEATLEVRDLEIVDRAEGQSALILPHLSLAGIRAGWSETRWGALAIEELRIVSGRIATALEGDGRLRLVELFSPVPREAGPAAGGSDPGEGRPSPDRDPPVDPDGGTLPELRVDRIRVEDFAIDFEDRTATRPVGIRLSSLRLAADDLRTERGASFGLDLEARVGEDGRIRMQGPVVIDPFGVRLGIRGEGIGIGDFEPYLEEVARLEIPRGALSLDLDLSLGNALGDDPGKDRLALFLKGDLEVADLETRDPVAGEEFLGWRRVHLGGIDFGPDRLDVDTITIDQPRIRLVVGRSGGSNLDAILGVEEARESRVVEAAALVVAPEEKAARRIGIGRIEIDDLELDFVDHGIDPTFHLGLDTFSGWIRGLSSEAGTRAPLEFQGRIEEMAPIRVEGAIDPFPPEPFAEIRISVSDLSMPIFSPYSARHVGYRIDRGKLALELDYRLEGRTLVGENQVSMDRFAFGEKVESDQATSLPIPLAVALLRDPSGRIELDLPLRGDLGDPGFNPIALLGKTVVNLVTRVVAAPFSIVGGLVGAESEALASVFFAPASRTLSSEEAAELNALAGVLAERPSIRVEIRGAADPRADGPALGVGDGEEARARLVRLAKARAQAVREALLGSGKLEADRLFLVDVEIVEAATAAGIPTRLSLRVD
ncbi:MAG TPA: DUF748 domain-containing protein [Deltaproteobacteria bacterium]|nr:DUF748 domain-containing protein [Deltaproteobacteria bacterium]